MDDFVLRRSDGLPTYNFAVVIDDALMNITHVIRGDDHITNTPLQIMLYKALNFKLPQFAHLPMIAGPDKTRLSKRHGATALSAYMEDGILPSVMFNFLARLGWGYENKEIFTKKELIELFKLEKVSKNAAVFDTQKLEWLNAQYIKDTEDKELVNMVKPFWQNQEGVNIEQYNEQKLIAIVKSFKERSKTLKDMAYNSSFYFMENINLDPEAKDKFLTPDKKPILENLIKELEKIKDWKAMNIENMFRTLSAKLNIKLVEIAQPARAAVTGKIASPPLFEVLEILGRTKSLNRLNHALKFI